MRGVFMISTVKKIMKCSSFFCVKLFIFSLLTCVCFGWTSDELDEEIARLDKIRNLLEKQFWNLKQKNMKKREEYDDRLSIIVEQVKTGYLKKNNLTEEMFLLKENLAKIEEQFQQVISEENEFKNAISERVDAEGRKLEFSYPYLLSKKLPEVNSLQKDLNAYPLEQVITKLVDYKMSLIVEAETVVLGTGIYVNEDAASRFRAPYVRVGFIHQSYSSPEQSALVIRESTIKGVRFSWESEISGELKNTLDKTIEKVINGKSDKASSDTLISINIDAAQSGKRLESFIRNDLSGFGNVVAKFFVDGGVIMYPMALLLALGLLLFFERVWFYRLNSIKKQFFMEEVLESIKQGKKEKAKEIFKNHHGIMERIFYLVMKNAGYFSRDDAERIIDEKILKETPALEKRLPTIAVIAAVAPLLGLLGTVSGMIQLFDVITAYGTADPKMLAGGISVALVTTQAGLGLAIPFMLAHHLLLRQKNNIITHLEQTAIRFLEVLYPDNKSTIPIIKLIKESESTKKNKKQETKDRAKKKKK